MKDFNFFEPYLTNKKETNIPTILIPILSAAVALMVIIFPIVQYIHYRNINETVTAMRDELASDDVQEKLKNIEELKRQLEEVRAELKWLDAVEATLEKRDVINDGLLGTITTSLPSEVFLKNIKMNDKEIQVEGVAKEKEKIAQLQYQLRKSLTLEDIFVSNINSAGELNEFMLTIEMRGEENNEVD